MRRLFTSARTIAFAAVCGVMLIGGLAWFAYGIATDGPGPNLVFGFGHYTGLRWPGNAQILRSGDSHRGFLGDGEFFVVADVGQGTIDRWLATAAPWDDWKPGPVPGEMGFHCHLGTPDGVGWGGRVGEPKQYTGNQELAALLSSEQIWYSARERGAGSLRWHNGDLLVLDPIAGRVWLSVWDF